MTTGSRRPAKPRTAPKAKAPGEPRVARRRIARAAEALDGEQHPEVSLPAPGGGEGPEEGGTELTPEQILQQTAAQVDGLVVGEEVYVGVLFMRPLNGQTDPNKPPVEFFIKGVSALEAPGLGEIGLNALKRKLGMSTPNQG